LVGQVDLYFSDAEMAALYNSEGKMRRRIGDEGYALVGRHLGELAALDGAEVAALPEVALESGPDRMTIVFGGGRVTIVVVPLGNEEPIDEIEGADGLQILGIAVSED
jgi:hypothetical protein